MNTLLLEALLVKSTVMLALISQEHFSDFLELVIPFNPLSSFCKASRFDANILHR